MPSPKEYLSKEKFKELSTELDHLRTVRRKEIADELEYAKSLGDLSENAEYHEARESQAALEDRISQLESVLASAEIMAVHHSSTVEVGAKVHIKRMDGKDKSEKKYILVGSEETDMTTGKISFKSPLAQAMIGKKKGDEFSFKTPMGVVKYVIVSID